MNSGALIGKLNPVPFMESDAGRNQSRRPRQKNDCSVRAVATVRGMFYDDAYDLMKSAGRECSSKFDFRSWAIDQDWLKWIPFPGVLRQPRMNPATFCEKYKQGRFIAQTARHVFAIVDGVCVDDFIPHRYRCIYGVWRVLERREHPEVVRAPRAFERYLESRGLSRDIFSALPNERKNEVLGEFGHSGLSTVSWNGDGK